MINVTKTFLPPREEYEKYLDQIWSSNWITNKGPLSEELEGKLKSYLDVKHLILVSNGTIALQLLYKALGLKNKAITTPFTYVATTSSLVWEGIEPVFCDIDSETLCPSPETIELTLKKDKSISAIVLTHVYGNSGPLEEFEKLAKQYKIPLILDAAHSFNVGYNGQSVLNYGNASTLSFHATKLFHTIEGGAIVTNDDELASKVEYMRRFGHDDKGGYYGLGINGKSSEFNAAMGLAVLPYVKEIIEKRKKIFDIYDKVLKGKVQRMNWNNALDKNYAYYPVFFKDEEEMFQVRSVLLENNINPRRYFHPSLNELPYVKGIKCPVSENVASKVLCLPLDTELEEKQVKEIAECVLKGL